MNAPRHYWGLRGGGGGLLTSLEVPWLGSDISEVHICFAAIYNGVGVLAGSVRGPSVRHRDLQLKNINV